MALKDQPKSSNPEIGERHRRRPYRGQLRRDSGPEPPPDAPGRQCAPAFSRGVPSGRQGQAGGTQAARRPRPPWGPASGSLPPSSVPTPSWVPGHRVRFTGRMYSRSITAGPVAASCGCAWGPRGARVGRSRGGPPSAGLCSVCSFTGSHSRGAEPTGSLPHVSASLRVGLFSSCAKGNLLAKVSFCASSLAFRHFSSLFYFLLTL